MVDINADIVKPAGVSINTGPLGLFSLEGRLAVVTGGFRGLGRMIADGLASAGARVIVSTRTLGVTASADVPYDVIEADLDSAKGIELFVDQLKCRADHLDLLVNNAGSTAYAPLEEYDEEIFNQVYRLNVTAPFSITRRCIGLLTAREGAPGRVINVGSSAGIRPGGKDNFAYSSSKAALHMVTRQLALELAPRGVCVNAIAPGPFLTPLFEESAARRSGVQVALQAIPLGRAGEPKDIAAAALYLGSPAAAYVTGIVLSVDGGLTAS